IGDRLLMLLCRALALLLRRGDGGLGLRQLDVELAHAALPIQALLLARGEELAHEGGEPGLVDRAAGLAGDVAQRVALGLDDRDELGDPCRLLAGRTARRGLDAALFAQLREFGGIDGNEGTPGLV